MQKINCVTLLGVLLILSIMTTVLSAGEVNAGANKSMGIQKENADYPMLTPESTITNLLENPAFRGFGRHLLARDEDASRGNVRLRDVRVFLPYHSHIVPDTVVKALNRMIGDARAGKTIFYDFYTEQEKRDDLSKDSTGLFFFRGKPGAPFAVICPGGGFSYVGSFHEGFPYAAELNKAGYNAFVLRYRVGRGGEIAAEDLAEAISFIFTNAESLGVSREGYSLWGSSVGARMVACVGSEGVAAFGGRNLPKPAVVVMAYTGHAAFTRNDPPTFVTVSEDDPIVSASAVERRVNGMKRTGVDVEFLKYRHAGHGFGLGIGTDAEGWVNRAIRFWEKYLPGLNSKMSLPGGSRRHLGTISAL